MFLLPISTDRPRLRPAYATLALIGINVLIHTWGASFRGGSAALVSHYGLWANHQTALAFLTYQFIHGGWLHLAGNMLFLWIFGSLIEDAIRPWGLVALYLGGGLCAAAAHLGMSAALGHHIDGPMVGASGAVAAIMGLFMLRFHRTRVEIYYWVFYFLRGTFWVRSIWALLFWLGLEVVDGVLTSFSKTGGGVAHWAHVGGFLAGAAFAPFIGSISDAKREYFTDDPETNVEYLRRNELVKSSERALAADPGNAFLMRRLAQHYRFAGDYEKATELLQKCVYRFGTRAMLDQASEVYLELVEYNDAAVIPPDLRCQMAKHLEAKHVAWAVWSYERIVREHVTRPEAEFALLRLAAIHNQSLHQPEEALRCLNEFLLRYPQSEWIEEAKQAHRVLTLQLQPQ